MADVMERLSAANPVPECSPRSIDEVWRRLEETSTADEPLAKGTTAGAHRWRRRRRPDLALVAVGLSVLAVVAIFGIGPFAQERYPPHATLGHQDTQLRELEEQGRIQQIGHCLGDLDVKQRDANIGG